MGRIKDNNYYQVSGWMVNQLGLSGRELHAYAIIYGFTQDEETEFNGSLKYIMEWLGTSSFHTVLRALNSLQEKGLITKRQTETNGVKNNFYRAVIPAPSQKNPPAETAEGTAKTAEGHCQNGRGGTAKTAEGGTAKTAVNNNTNNIINIYMDIREEKKALIPCEKIKNLYNDIAKSLPKCLKLSENRKKHIAARWNEYGGDLETFVTLFTKAEASSFLTGNNDRGWAASFDWLMKPDNMTKVLEGKYDNKGGGNNAARVKQGSEKPRLSTADYEQKLREAGQLRDVPDFDAMFAAH